MPVPTAHVGCVGRLIMNSRQSRDICRTMIACVAGTLLGSVLTCQVAGDGETPAPSSVENALSRLETSWSNGDEEAGRLYAAFLLHHSNGDQAIEVCQRILARHPGDRETRLACAAAMIKVGRCAEVQTLLEPLLEASSKDAHASFLIGLATIRQCNGAYTEDGRRWMERAILESPQFTRPRYELAKLLSDSPRTSDRVLNECRSILILEEPGSSLAEQALLLATQVTEGR